MITTPTHRGDNLDALAALAEAARDPFLVILESHPDGDLVANFKMKRAADCFRAALAGLEDGASQIKRGQCSQKEEQR